MIETERLILRPYTTEDFAAYWAMLCEPVDRFPSRQTLSQEDAWQRILAAAGHWAMFGYGLLAVVDKATGDYAGETGLVNMQRDIGEHLSRCDEAGWYLTAQARGRGLGLEAAQAVHGWYAARFAGRRTYCIVDSANTPSLNLAIKLGYEARDLRSCGNQELVIFERSGAKGTARFYHAPSQSAALH
ncbi:GNAT family N-acetyltransferase [Novosphingobium sp. JCM 18896]|uniref:GNAT family N-acetyltransferase n=1 Tax=Novosphingobium sp. JCM 18896 TaxID=2989731 RepID=UPI002222CBA6|nr:GNAT family N-acetyltransferase [Novosphingobium sp. JCM 18896]MCW1429854.1 GNAT family N-acetyltransferase [Novosphingobium sp. JCM 18896]